MLAQQRVVSGRVPRSWGSTSADARPIACSPASSRAAVWNRPTVCCNAGNSHSVAGGEEAPSTSGREHLSIPAPRRSSRSRIQHDNNVAAGQEVQAASWLQGALTQTLELASGPGALLCAAVCCVSLLLPEAAYSSEGTLTGQSFQLFTEFLEQVEALGPYGPVLFVVVVMLFEMVPLFPTQPLSLASGLLFGPQKGALCMLLGVTLAAMNAFLLARGVGRPLAQKVIEAEMSHAGEAGSGGAVATKLAEVQAAIEGGGPLQQLTAIALLRLTPVVPFSASNYLLGLTPVQLPPYLGGTLVGMSVWSVLYASIGGASRQLLENGADIGDLIADLGSKASEMSASIAGYSAIAVAVGAGLWAFNTSALRNHVFQSRDEGDSSNGGNGTTSNRGPATATTATTSSASGSSMDAQDSGSEAEGTNKGNGNGSKAGSIVKPQEVLQNK